MGAPLTLRPALTLTHVSGHRAGDERFRLLEAIERLGSISAAARELGLSYKAAWDAVYALNNLFPRPLVLTRPGGLHGGGAEVTAAGRQALAVQRHLASGLAKICAALEESLRSEDGASEQSFLHPGVLLLMRTSARNCLHGVLESVTPGAINTEVSLRIADDTCLVVTVTNHSAAELGLHAGQHAYALIKASAPILTKGPEGLRMSTRNRLSGKVVAVERGAVNVEVVLEIGHGKTLVSMLANDEAEPLELRPGDRCSALVKSSQIILGVD